MNLSPFAYFRHRFPAEIISHCVWLYFRFTLSFRDVEEMMAKRGIVVTYESVSRVQSHWKRAPQSVSVRWKVALYALT